VEARRRQRQQLTWPKSQLGLEGLPVILLSSSSSAQSNRLNFFPKYHLHAAVVLLLLCLLLLHPPSSAQPAEQKGASQSKTCYPMGVGWCCGGGGPPLLPIRRSLLPPNAFAPFPSSSSPLDCQMCSSPTKSSAKFPQNFGPLPHRQQQQPQTTTGCPPQLCCLCVSRVGPGRRVIFSPVELHKNNQQMDGGRK
jgi:hypothetical protein